jgi:hypothetical protein
VEAVRRGARLVDLGDRKERRVLGGRRERQVHAVLLEPGSQDPAEPVRGQPAEERDVTAETTKRPGGVERATTGNRLDPTVKPDDEVHEALAGDDDEVAIAAGRHRRIVRRVGGTG